MTRCFIAYEFGSKVIQLIKLYKMAIFNPFSAHYFFISDFVLKKQWSEAFKYLNWGHYGTNSRFNLVEASYVFGENIENIEHWEYWKKNCRMILDFEKFTVQTRKFCEEKQTNFLIRIYG